MPQLVLPELTLRPAPLAEPSGGEAELGVDGPNPAGGHPYRIVFRLTSRQALRSGLLWGYVFGAYIAVQALTYASTYKTTASRDALGEVLLVE